MFRIYYADGSFYEGDDPYLAPCLGVLCIVQSDPNPEIQYHVLDRFDFYWWRDQWYGGEIFGLWEYLSESGPKAVKFGRTVSNEQYRYVHKLAVDYAKSLR